MKTSSSKKTKKPAALPSRRELLSKMRDAVIGLRVVWYSVKQQVPAEFERVLVAVDPWEAERFDFQRVEIGYWHRDDWFRCEDHAMLTVTHWAHLPTPPNGKACHAL